MKADIDFVLIEVLSEEGEAQLDAWFAERRSSAPPPRQSVPPLPMGDDEVDGWLR